MDIINIIIQGIIQGLTEFLPVSSSGHLSVAQHFMGIGEESVLISVVLHSGTLIAVFIAFRKPIAGMIKEFFLSIGDIFAGRFSWRGMNDDRRMMVMVIIATLVLVPFVLVKDFFESFSGDGDIVFEGFAFIFTALELILADACVKGYKTGKDMTVKDAVTVGLFQCAALFPGVTRSGSTVSSGLFCGLTRETAFNFSFILGIPAILGSCVLEAVDVVKSGESTDPLPLIVGAAVSAVVGLLSIKLVKLVIKNDKFRIFGIYALILGILCVCAGAYEHITSTRLFIG